MRALKKIWRLLSVGRIDAGHASGRNDAPALRLYSLPRGIRQRARHSLLWA